MPPMPGVSLELLYTQMSYLSGFTPETNIQPASGANTLIRCTGFKSHAVLRGRLRWRWGSGSGANVSGKKWCHGFSVSSYFTGLAQGQTSFVWRYGGGIGGGIMTAESISASRAAVRSKSQHGENMKGGEAAAPLGLGSALRTDVMTLGVALLWWHLTNRLGITVNFTSLRRSRRRGALLWPAFAVWRLRLSIPLRFTGNDMPPLSPGLYFNKKSSII